ncbi:unnamed protein product [Tenebrio molitor]|nr:unnamed protein product [Tenebrio molitor]
MIANFFCRPLYNCKKGTFVKKAFEYPKPCSLVYWLPLPFFFPRVPYPYSVCI